MTAAWQQQLRSAYKTPEKLCADLGLAIAQSPYVIEQQASFACLVPAAFVEQMRSGDWYDPLLLQVLPRGIEGTGAGILDPVGEHGLVQQGIIHKYHGRALWVLTSGCAVNCRYCFRRHFDYAGQVVSTKRWQENIAYLQNDTSIKEIILSGGDPLLLADELLAELLLQLEQVEHLQTIRIHTRLPIVLPARITSQLLAMLASSSKQIVVVVHCNHPNELSTLVQAALVEISTAVDLLLNQSVLLAGINDDIAVLCALSEKLFAAKCLPYYMHMLDEVAGAMHFKVAMDKALALRKEMAASLPGYLVPRWVQDLPGSVSKQDI